MAGRVFLCHSSGDRERVRDLHRRLRRDGVELWLDEEDILPGQDWQHAIRRAIRESRCILVFLSRNSVTKRGFIQKEIRQALDVADEQPEGSIFLIPVRLELCEVPDRLGRWQWTDLFAAGGYERLLLSLRQGQPPASLPTPRPLGDPLEGHHTEAMNSVASAPDGKLPVPAALARLPDVRDPLIAGHFYERLATHALADNVFGARYAICGVWHDVQALEQVFPSARDPIRAELLRLRAWYAGRIGWLCLETGDLVSARFWADKMQDIAYELGDGNLLIYCFSLKARHAIERQEPGQATGLAVAALESGLHAFEPDRGLGLIANASAFASAHDQTRCARAIDEAMHVALSDSEDPHHIKTFFVPSFVAIEAAGCWLQLGKPEKVIELFEEGARTGPESFKRNRGLNLSRLANAYAQIGNHGQANLVGLESIEIALRTHSASTIRELMRLRARLRSQVGPSTLEEFDQAMRNLLTVAGRPQTLG